MHPGGGRRPRRHARGYTVPEFTRIADRIVADLDPPRPGDAHRRRYLHLSRLPDGSLLGRFACGPAQALTLTTVLAALAGPRPGKAIDADGVEHDLPDERTPAERRMDALAEAVDHNHRTCHCRHTHTHRGATGPAARLGRREPEPAGRTVATASRATPVTASRRSMNTADDGFTGSNTARNSDIDADGDPDADDGDATGGHTRSGTETDEGTAGTEERRRQRRRQPRRQRRHGSRDRSRDRGSDLAQSAGPCPIRRPATSRRRTPGPAATRRARRALPRHPDHRHRHHRTPRRRTPPHRRPTTTTPRLDRPPRPRPRLRPRTPDGRDRRGTAPAAQRHRRHRR